MKKIFLIIGIISMTCGCQSRQDSKSSGNVNPDFHKVLVLEAINTSAYTYLRVKENENEKWLAVPLMPAKAGETYYYGKEMLMTNFVSRELNRTFETIYFLDGVSTEPPVPGKSLSGNSQKENMPSGNQGVMSNESMNENAPRQGSAAIAVEKSDIKIRPAKGAISISELFSKKESYAGKKVLITGKVIKFSPLIMDRNWVHIQDGSDFNGKFDLTVTTGNNVKVNDIVSFEGTIALGKDFGAGYFYEIIMEDAIIK